MNLLRNYFRQLKEILKKQMTLYLVVLSLSALFFLRLAFVAFFGHSGIRVDWVVFGLIALLVLSFVFQALLLLKKCYPLFLFRVLIVIFLAFQLGYRAYYTFRPPPLPAKVEVMGESYSIQDDLLGFRLKPNLHDAWQWSILVTDTIEKVCFSTDSFSRRIPDDAFMGEYLMNQNHPYKHALFFGCSFTFGYGLMYSSTFPYLFEKQNPDYKSYNYGVSGFGPHQIALLFDQRVNVINRESVKEPDGFALYTYIDDHLNRVYVGSKNFRRAAYLPTSFDIENDSLVIKEWSQKQLLHIKILEEINLIRFVDLQFSYPRKKSMYKRFASIINYTAKKYWEFNPGNHFYVSIYPGYDKDLNWIPYLDEKIAILRMNPPSDYDNKSKYEIYPPYDQHPSRVANEYYAAELTRLINKYE